MRRSGEEEIERESEQAKADRGLAGYDVMGPSHSPCAPVGRPSPHSELSENIIAMKALEGEKRWVGGWHVDAATPRHPSS